MLRTPSLSRCLRIALAALALTGASVAQEPLSPSPGGSPSARVVLPMPGYPEKLPAWMSSRKPDRVFYKRGPYNFAIYNIPDLARDLNAVAVGHAMAYEALVTGGAVGLETVTFNRIDGVLKRPPRLMPDEAAVSPTFGRKYGYLEQVFDWAHILHAQTVDVLTSTALSPAEKDREIERLYAFYRTQAPYVITPLPMNMEFLDGQSYSMTFRKKYPKVNGLFWGYHWLQGAMYDLLWGQSLEQQRQGFRVIGERYHATELYKTDRYFMPMFADTSPRFSQRFPKIANVFDNLHMLHDMVNDILATEALDEAKKEREIRRAIWIVLESSHQGDQAGSLVSHGLHDHRHMEGMPGMGMMKGATPQLMYMQSMGAWMSFTDCGHCSMPMPEGEDAWRAPTVSGEGWSMRVRCAACARDMAAQAKGKVVVRIPTEDPLRPVFITSDDHGNFMTDLMEAVFLEKEAGHAGCDDWSRAFTSSKAFEAYAREHPQFAQVEPLDFKTWSEREGKKPDTYVKPQGPVENPFEEPTGRN